MTHYIHTHIHVYIRRYTYIYTYMYVYIGMKQVFDEAIFAFIRYKTFFFFINLFFIYLFLSALGLRCCTRAFSSCGKWGYSLLWCSGFLLRWLLLLRSAGSRRAGFSSCGTWAQQLWLAGSRTQAQQAQQLQHTGLVALQHVGSSRTRERTCVPCIGRRILNHHTTREVPEFIFVYV